MGAAQGGCGALILDVFSDSFEPWIGWHRVSISGCWRSARFSLSESCTPTPFSVRQSFVLVQSTAQEAQPPVQSSLPQRFQHGADAATRRPVAKSETWLLTFCAILELPWPAVRPENILSSSCTLTPFSGDLRTALACCEAGGY